MSFDNPTTEAGNCYSVAAELLSREDKYRRAVARELHDKAGQQIAVLGYELDRLASGTKSDDSIRLELGTLHQQLDDLAATLRSIERRLHPSILTDLGLSAALRSLTAKLHEEKAQTITTCIAEVAEDLPAPIALGCYRIAEQALDNAARHAPNSPVDLTLVQNENRLLLIIRDHGPGFEDSKLTARNIAGVLMMHARASGIEGTLHIASEPNHGTTISLTVPLEPSHSTP